MQTPESSRSSYPNRDASTSHEQATQDHCEHTQHRHILGLPLENPSSESTTRRQAHNTRQIAKLMHAATLHAMQHAFS